MNFTEKKPTIEQVLSDFFDDTKLSSAIRCQNDTALLWADHLDDSKPHDEHYNHTYVHNQINGTLKINELLIDLYMLHQSNLLHLKLEQHQQQIE